ncbi:MAG: hypothetical protein H7238_06060 [Polaromonas sp.]|nr:hypothetical protein [Polaromonas sp.]
MGAGNDAPAPVTSCALATDEKARPDKAITPATVALKISFIRTPLKLKKDDVTLKRLCDNSMTAPLVQGKEAVPTGGGAPRVTQLTQKIHKLNVFINQE